FSRARRCGGCTTSAFFFQAEDGIRDFHVTGVQTCALPILRFYKTERQDMDWTTPNLTPEAFTHLKNTSLGKLVRDHLLTQIMAEIGRASCRERAELPGDTAWPSRGTG